MTAAALTTYGAFFHTGGGTVAPGANLPLTTRKAVSTGDLTLGTNSVIINTPGVYLVTYQYNPTNTDPQNSLGDAQLILNGTPIPGSDIYSNPSPASVTPGSLGAQPATGTTLVNVTTAGSTLALQNTGSNGASIILGGGAGTVMSTQLTLVKVG
ncbi:hypothetical protein KM892_19895 [Bacillus pumilus]|nr:hypothetical protein [Bacillus pumilus]